MKLPKRRGLESRGGGANSAFSAALHCSVARDVLRATRTIEQHAQTTGRWGCWGFCA